MSGYKNRRFHYDYAFCKSQKVYFPFMTIFNDTQRWFRPLDVKTIEMFIRGEEITETPYIREWSRSVFEGTTQLLTKENIELVKTGCTLSGCEQSCLNKGLFLEELGLDAFGIVHSKEGVVVGGAEYLPSLKVPYDIPRDEYTAFLTCLYHSSEEYDYKSVPLKELENILRSRYKTLLAVTDEVGSFPNGDLKWFLARGYRDLGVISVEED